MLKINIKNSKNKEVQIEEKEINFEERIVNLAIKKGFSKVQEKDKNRKYRTQVERSKELKDSPSDTIDLEEYKKAVELMGQAKKKVENSISAAEKKETLLETYRQDILHMLELCDLTDEEKVEAATILGHLGRERREYKGELKKLKRIYKAQKSMDKKLAPLINQLNQILGYKAKEDTSEYVLRADVDLVLRNSSQIK